MKNCWVCLGRTGDIISMLPLVLHDYQRGNQPTVVVSEPWSDLLDGVGYADKLVWNSHYSQPIQAKRWVESLKRFDKIYVPQCYGQVFDRKCTNFCEEAWRLADMDSLWGRIPLVFDRRNKEREKKLIPCFNKPVILVNTEGISSAFSKRKEMFDVLAPLRETHEIVDMSLVKADRFYDLIGLYEEAEYLVCIDSGPLHLAQAVPSLNVIAMIQNGWGGSPPRSNHLLRIRYEEFDSRKSEITDAILLKKKSEPKMIHVWSKYNIVKSDAQNRHRMAKQTWDKEMNGWIDLPMEETSFARTSRTDFNDYKCAPYIPDIIDKAMKTAEMWDIVVLTNDDTCVCPGLATIIKHVIADCGACWGARREQRSIKRVLTTDEIMRGSKHVGADVFAFTKKWWVEHGWEMPAMLMAFENWDYVLRTVVNDNGGREVEGLCYHEEHTGEWLKNRTSLAARHNQLMGGEFFNARI